MSTHRVNWSKIIAFDGATLSISEGSKSLVTTDLERVSAQMQEAGFTKSRSKRVSQVARRIMRAFRRRELPDPEATSDVQVGKLSKPGWTCFAFLADDEEVLKAAREGELTNGHVAAVLEAAAAYREEASSNVRRSLDSITKRLNANAA